MFNTPGFLAINTLACGGNFKWFQNRAPQVPNIKYSNFDGTGCFSFPLHNLLGTIRPTTYLSVGSGKKKIVGKIVNYGLKD